MVEVLVKNYITLVSVKTQREILVNLDHVLAIEPHPDVIGQVLLAYPGGQAIAVMASFADLKERAGK